MATLPRLVEPPFYDPPIVDNRGGQQHSQAWTEYHQAVSDRLSDLGTNKGVTDGTDAVAGQVGEYMTASAGPVSVLSGTNTNVVSLSLTAGDWDVSGNLHLAAAAGTSHNAFGGGIGGLDTFIAATFPAAATDQFMTTAVHRYNVTTPTTVWLIALAFFAGGTVTATGTIRARRMR